MADTITKGDVKKASPSKPSLLISKPDDELPIFQAAVLGLQHLLAMDVYVVPILIATMLGLNFGDKMGIVQATFLAAGIGTILQTGVFMKMPVTQGASFVPLGAIAGIYATAGPKNGMATVFGSLLIGAIAVILLGITHVLPNLIHKFVPAIVGGTIITNVGLSLIPSAVNDDIFEASGNLNTNVMLGSVSALVLLICVWLGLRFVKLGRVFKLGSILISLLIGTGVAAATGAISLKTVAASPWFSLPKFSVTSYGLRFYPFAILTMLIIYMVLMTETTGTWFAVSTVTHTELTNERLNRGVIGEGISCVIASLAGATPVTGYSTNAGIISITGIASKRAFIAAGVWFIGFSFVGKIAALLSAIPDAVIGGVFAVVCVTIMINGLRVVSRQSFEERNLYILGIPIILTMATVLMPTKLIDETPQFVQYLLGSPIAISAIAATLLNQLMPKTRKAIA